MSKFPTNILEEPAKVDGNTLANLGPLTSMAGIWEGRKGVDVNPQDGASEKKPYLEHYELQPIDPQTNGPQLFYGLRYHTFIREPRKNETYHDQLGYWLWEPATGSILHTLAIPRGQIAMATGTARPDATSFELVAKRGELTNGIISNPFLEHAFTTVAWRILVTINADGTWSYDQDTQIKVKGQRKLFHHTDRNTLTKIGEPTPNLLARKKK